MATTGPFPMSKVQLRHDTDHSPPSSAKVKNDYELQHGMQQDSFTFSLLLAKIKARNLKL
jgi:hypothetical protein